MATDFRASLAKTLLYLVLDSPSSFTVPGDISDDWYKKIYSFSRPADSETVLIGWISGKEAEYVETLPDSIVADKCTSILRKFLNDPYVPKPKACVW